MLYFLLSKALTPTSFDNTFGILALYSSTLMICSKSTRQKVTGAKSMDYKALKDKDGKPYLKVSLTDYALLHHSILNKGMSFSHQEREEFELLGLLPPQETTLATQRARSYDAFKNKTSDIEKYIYLRDLQNSNETLFYSLILEHLDEMMPIVYTPTVGVGCEKYSYIYRRPRGVYIAYPDRHHIDKILANRHFNHIKVIVASDGERILGLGDQGAGGMGIPIGKLALYTACAGIHPSETLPILLDTGTNNLALQSDSLYIGWHHERVRGKEYDDFIEQFVQAVKKRFPHVLLQWEDFAQQNANPILERYRNTLCTFNDDIQGTAAVAAGTLIAAINVTGTRLRDQRIAVFGAGSAGCGISALIKQTMIADGLSEQEARRRFFLIDKNGLIMQDMPDLLPFQQQFAQERDTISDWQLENANKITLKDVVKNSHPTLLIGVSAQANAFTKDIIREMATHTERPIIFPLSNPQSRCEATPEDLMQWTHAKAIIGTGSPFAEIKKNGRPFRVDQTNNCYIFPGIGLGVMAVKAKFITDNMFMAAAKALAECSPAKQDPEANLLPSLNAIRTVSLQVAIAVAKEAIAVGVADFPDNIDLEKHIQTTIWTPEYLPYKK
jgi:malate dehydrogenase (oxaloacetate-decarboxylating)